MAGIIGQDAHNVVGFEVNPYLSTDLGKMGLGSPFNPVPVSASSSDSLPLSRYRLATTNAWQVSGQAAGRFFDDYYNRIHLDPTRIDLQTIASTQTRTVFLWNAYTDQNTNIDGILISQPDGIEISGQSVPYSMPPLKGLEYQISVGVSGAPSINTEIQFDFTNVTNPPALLITGSRAVKLANVPEVPVVETWEWLSDNIVSVDGSEQRIALRGETPRSSMQLNITVDKTQDARTFYADIMAAGGRLWVPEYQYSTRTTDSSQLGGFDLHFNNNRTDVRAGEYVLVTTPDNSELIEVATIEPYGATVTAALKFDIPKNSLVTSGSTAIVDDNATVSRYSVDNVANMQVTANLVRDRVTLTRPQADVALSYFLDDPILDKRPLANDLVGDSISTGQITLDNGVGTQDALTRWEYARLISTREYKVDRMYQPEQMDWWKAVFAHARGQARKFWVPTYRSDLELREEPNDNASAYILSGATYANKVYPIITHRHIEIETAAGIHRATVIGASANDDLDYSTIGISPPVPEGEDWMDVKRISYLLPMRLASDVVIWNHYGLESILELSLRTAEP